MLVTELALPQQSEVDVGAIPHPFDVYTNPIEVIPNPPQPQRRQSVGEQRR